MTDKPDKILEISRTVRESLDDTFITANLTNITTTTPINGGAVTVAKFTEKSVFVNLPTAVGTATVRVEGSPDRSTWIILNTKTITGTPTAYVFSTGDYFPFMRTSVTAVASSTVSTIITGHGV